MKFPIGRRAGAVTFGAWLVLSLPATAGAQLFSACIDTLALLSPSSIDVAYETGVIPGASIRWNPLPVIETGCYRLSAAPDLVARVNPQMSGFYTNLFDQTITFTLADSALVGSKTDDRVRVTLSTVPPAGAAVPPLGGAFNLSNRGGFYRVGLTGSVSATQSNQNVPNHLSQTEINDFAVFVAPGGGSTRIYAAIQDLPLVYSDDAGISWTEPAIDFADPIGFPIIYLAVDPLDRDVLYAGTRKRGLWRSRNGGQTFENLDPTGSVTPGQSQEVTALEVLELDVGGQTVRRLFANIAGKALYYSDDQGDSWGAVPLPRVPSSDRAPGNGFPCSTDILATVIPATILAVAPSLSNPQRFYVGSNGFGFFRTDDGGASWSEVDTFLVRCGSPMSITEIFVAPNGGGADWILAASARRGVFVSQDGGATWLTSLGIPINPATGNPIVLSDFVRDPNNPDRIYAASASNGLFVTDTRGSAWAPLSYGGSALPTPRLGALALNPGAATDELIVGTVGAGVYEPGALIDLNRVLNPPAGSFEGVDISLGLSISFDPGVLRGGETMDLRVQSFQGYAVWRAERLNLMTDEPLWKLIGLYDLTNPETCVIGSCSNPSPTIIPGCFAEKRANCFSFRADGSVDFFDRDVFTGFTYQYAVSSFDYGFVGDTSPGSFAGEMLFSPRSAEESTPEATLFNSISPVGSNRNYNHVEFQVNPTALDPDDPANRDVDLLANVYVAPNPLRRRAGWDDGDESSVRFFNVAAGATCEVFTLAGDLVRRLRNVNIAGESKGIIEWDTRNEAGGQVTSGVYIYRITTPRGDERVDHLTIIR
jgi:photosystem II stability/assembly factor-like uncharacterized protein